MGAGGKDANKANDAGQERLMNERVMRYQIEYFPAPADYDLCLELKPAGQFRTELRFADLLADYKCACGANVYGTEVIQLFRKQFGPEGFMPADVDTSEKSHKCHESFFSVSTIRSPI
jgi:hypothetical protein